MPTNEPTLPADVAALVERVQQAIEREKLNLPLKASTVTIHTLEDVAAALASARRVGPSVEEVALTICRSGKFETGEGTCSLRCMDQLGDPRKRGCSHATKVHADLTEQILALGQPEITVEEAGSLPATPDAERAQLRDLIGKYGRYDEEDGPWSAEIKAAVREVEDRFDIFLCASDFMAVQFERAERAEKRLARLRDRPRIIRALQENLSCEYDNDQKGDASWRVTGIEAAADAILAEQME